MNSRSFDYTRIAKGYAKDRPYLHPQVIKIVQKDLELNRKLLRGLDVGCGAGLSSKALRLLCEQVTGTDISLEMIQMAKEICSEAEYSGEAGYSFCCCMAEEIPHNTVYDIVTAAGVVNWVDQAAFLENTGKLLKKDGCLVVYDFWITDQMLESPDYTKWWKEQYILKFPKPYRRENWWTIQEVEPFGFLMTEQKEIKLTWKFDLESFVRFMMIQSNVNEQIEQKRISEDEAESWFFDSLSEIFVDKIKTLVFCGYLWYIKKI